jgi:hypothetical protein
MPLTYEQSAALMQDGVFIGRVKVGCITFARYIMDESAAVPAHSTRIKWAQSTLASPDAAAQQLTPTVVMDPSVQADGATVSDAELQGAVEAAVNKLI